MEHVVESFVVPALGAPVPLMAEQLVDVLALLEKQEKEEDAMMVRLEDMIPEGKSVSAADMEAWRRWAKAGGMKKKRKKRRKKKLPKTTCVMQVEFQQSKFESMEAPQFRFIDRVCWLFQ